MGIKRREQSSIEFTAVFTILLILWSAFFFWIEFNIELNLPDNSFSLLIGMGLPTGLGSLVALAMVQSVSDFIFYLYFSLYPQKKAEELTLLGKNNLRNKNFGLAIDHLTEAIKINPYSTDAYYFRARVNEELLKFQEAINDYTELVNIEPGEIAIYHAIAEIKERLKDKNGASEYHKKAKNMEEVIEEVLMHIRLVNEDLNTSKYWNVESKFNKLDVYDIIKTLPYPKGKHIVIPMENCQFQFINNKPNIERYFKDSINAKRLVTSKGYRRISFDKIHSKVHEVTRAESEKAIHLIWPMFNL